MNFSVSPLVEVAKMSLTTQVIRIGTTKKATLLAGNLAEARATLTLLGNRVFMYLSWSASDMYRKKFTTRKGSAISAVVPEQ